MKIYNTLTRKIEEFKPIKKGQVGMYTCGLTVYDFGHIGNFRSFMFVDLLKRYLKWKGFKVMHIMNITDVDDKTIKKSQEQKKSLKEFTEEYTKYFLEDMKVLNIEMPNKIPKATEHIKEMVEIIERLLEKKIAYKAEDGSIYYNLKKDKEYGKLAHLDKEGLKAGARVRSDEYDKENVNDFVLWKSYVPEDGDVFWDTKIGKGRPGWHIECSAMSTKYLGKTFDIHTGGVDLVFPHHENEIAQSEGAFGTKFVKYWLHCEHLVVEGRKMAKSLKNFYTLRDLQEYSSRAIRYLLMSTHYRQQLNFTKEGLVASKQAVERIEHFIEKIQSNKGQDSVDVEKVKKEFERALDDDLNISKALGTIFEFIRETNKLQLKKESAEKVLKLFDDLDKILGLNLLKKEKEEKIPSEILKLTKEREQARKNKDWKKSDELRNKVQAAGYTIEDTEKGYKIKKL